MRRRVSESERVERLVLIDTFISRRRVTLRAGLRVGLRVEMRDDLTISVRVGERVGLPDIQLWMLIQTSISRRRGNMKIGLMVELRVQPRVGERVALWVGLMDIQRRVLIDTGLFNVIALAAFCKQLRWLLKESWLISNNIPVTCCKQFGIDHVVGDDSRIGAPADMFALGFWRATKRVHGG